jgi:hypothetical protein
MVVVREELEVVVVRLVLEVAVDMAESKAWLVEEESSMSVKI